MTWSALLADARDRAWWRLAGTLFAALVRLLPRRFRYHAAVTASIALLPLLRLSRAWRQRVKLALDTEPEIALELLLMTLTRHETLFDPRVTMVGEIVTADAARGTILIGAHMMLSTLMLRSLYDEGIRVAPVATVPMKISGTGESLEVIRGNLVLLKIARKLRSGGVVAVMIDRGNRSEPNTIEFETARGSTRIANPVLHLAVREKTRILFFGAKLRGRAEVVITFGRPSDESNGSVEAVTRDFVDFVQTMSAAS